MPRNGVLVKPYYRLNEEQVERIHRASLSILLDPGIICFNRDAAEIFGDSYAMPFIWIMPSSLAVGIVVSLLLSVLFPKKKI